MWSYVLMAGSGLTAGTLYYLYRYHPEVLQNSKLVQKGAEYGLEAYTWSRWVYHQYYPQQAGKVQPLQIHLVSTTEIQPIQPGDWLNIPSFPEGCAPDQYWHIIYELDEKIYRVVLSAHQNVYQFLSKIEQIQGKPRTSPEDWQTNLPVSSPNMNEQLQILISQYAGPLGDFYDYLDHQQPHEGFLKLEPINGHLLPSPYYLNVEDILGTEWFFGPKPQTN